VFWQKIEKGAVDPRGTYSAFADGMFYPKRNKCVNKQSTYLRTVETKKFALLMTGLSFFCMIGKNIWTKASTKEDLSCKFPLVDAFFHTQEYH